MEVRILPNQNARISCVIVDQTINKVLYQNHRVAECGANISTKDPHIVLISVTNESDEDITFKIWIHNPNTKF